MNKLYLDVCTLCRPFDDQNLMRIRLETDAVYLILQNVLNGHYEMVTSPVHFKEIEAITDVREKTQLTTLLAKYGKTFSWNLNKTRERAEQLVSLKFGVADAAHFAFAEAASDCLITCDDRFLKKARKLKTTFQIMNPIEFCINEDLK
ncbi:MAG: hypothetical protein HUU32_01055 [Calditrichaceae bacterium]|nr:hypothetical protein [Calditrichia bacterium]NUQ39962.1 hypothetical protein [Calditrichaceae bacterium]